LHRIIGMEILIRESSVATANSPPCQKGLRRMVGLALVLVLALAGCGQKGPLTLPASVGAASAPTAVK
jgi:predicted small lipoprotein YifL